VSVHATVFVPTDLQSIARDAMVIARGRVVAVTGQWTSDRRGIETMVTLETEVYLKGWFGETIQFRVPGGELGRYRSIVIGSPRFVPGQHVIVFLNAQGPSVPHVIGLTQGVYRVERASDGMWMVAPPGSLPGIAGPITRGSQSREPVLLEAFERDVRALAGAPR
jgi:hypothetical protein